MAPKRPRGPGGAANLRVKQPRALPARQARDTARTGHLGPERAVYAPRSARIKL